MRVLSGDGGGSLLVHTVFRCQLRVRDLVTLLTEHVFISAFLSHHSLAIVCPIDQRGLFFDINVLVFILFVFRRLILVIV